MIAGLLYLIGLIAVLVSIAFAGYSAPQAISNLTEAMDAGNANMLDVVLGIAQGYSGTLTWLIIGLLLMAAGRVIMLLSAINRSLRGQS